MKITFAPRGILQIDGAKIIFRNFSGVATKFNREGDRNFAVQIDDPDMADALTEQGWNVKIKPPREEGDEPFMYLPVKVQFNGRGPSCFLRAGDRTTELSEETVDILDNIEIISVDLDIRPYDWENNGRTGRSAYLQSIYVEQKTDRLRMRYESEN